MKLMMDGFLVNGLEELFDKFSGQRVGGSSIYGPGQDAPPAFGLQDRDVVFILDPSDLADQTHALRKHFDEPVIEFIDLLAQTFDILIDLLLIDSLVADVQTL